MALLSGGVGGARLARGLAALEDLSLTVIVNVADDEEIYGLHVSPDLDTVLYTLAGIEGPEGWGRADDRFTVMHQLGELGRTITFRIGDRDLATNLLRTEMLRRGGSLAAATRSLATALGVTTAVVPVTDDPVKTRILTAAGEWIGFQEYFVHRGQTDEVADLRYDGAAVATPAMDALSALETSDVVVIGPSNPPLSVWPILAVPRIADAVRSAGRVLAVSPLIGGAALKGPAHRVMATLGLPPGNEGVAAAYVGLLTDLVIDPEDVADRPRLAERGLRVHVRNTRIGAPEAATEFARWLMGLP